MAIQVIILGYDNLYRCGRTIDRFHNETDIEGLAVFVTLVDAKYPEPHKLVTSFRHLARSRHVDLITLEKNYGQDGNYNKLKEIMGFLDEDIIVYYDTDVAPKKPSWLKDALKVFENPEAGYVSMDCSCTDRTLLNQGAPSIIGGVPVREICWPGGIPIGIWRGAFVNRAKLHQSHPFYGGTEGNILNALRESGYKGYMMEEHDDGRDLVGQEGAYQLWKAEMIVKLEQQDFREWLKIHEEQQQGLLKIE